MYSPTAGRVLGFSGSRDLGLHPTVVRRSLAALLAAPALSDAKGFVTGACVGIDSFVGRLLADEYPAAAHTVVVPADRSRISRWWEPYPFVRVIEMEPFTSYRDRNISIVALSDWLWAFPKAGESDAASARSGTWQTIRLARHHHDPTPRFWLLDDLQQGRIQGRWSDHASADAPDGHDHRPSTPPPSDLGK